MMKLIVTLLIGMIFGLGIAISGMANPAKVLNFFDLAGTWDPSLIFVMGGALITTAIGYQIVFKTRTSPLMDIAYMVPSSKDIDTRLVVGSATFGVGWGIAGFCPGGAIPAIGLGYSETFMFMFALIAGIFIARLLNTKISAQTA